MGLTIWPLRATATLVSAQQTLVPKASRIPTESEPPSMGV
jgi:hypothetical protein